MLCRVNRHWPWIFILLAPSQKFLPYDHSLRDNFIIWSFFNSEGLNGFHDQVRNILQLIWENFGKIFTTDPFLESVWLSPRKFLSRGGLARRNLQTLKIKVKAGESEIYSHKFIPGQSYIILFIQFVEHFGFLIYHMCMTLIFNSSSPRDKLMHDWSRI